MVSNYGATSDDIKLVGRSTLDVSGVTLIQHKGTGSGVSSIQKVGGYFGGNITVRGAKTQVKEQFYCS